MAFACNGVHDCLLLLYKLSQIYALKIGTNVPFHSIVIQRGLHELHCFLYSNFLRDNVKLLVSQHSCLWGEFTSKILMRIYRALMIKTNVFLLICYQIVNFF